MSADRGVMGTGIVIGAGLLVIVAIAAYTFWPTPAPQVHGERLDLTYSKLMVYDRHDNLVAEAPYSARMSTVLSVVERALGAPESTGASSTYGLAIQTSQWEGLRVTSYRGHARSYSIVSVEAPQVRGVPVVAMGGYRVGGEFPRAGAHPTCSVEVQPSTFQGLIASLNPPRINLIEAPQNKAVVGIFESNERHGEIAGFQAPTFGEGC